MAKRRKNSRTSTSNNNFERESFTALQRVPYESRADAPAIESVIEKFMMDLENAKWPRALQWFENASMLLGNHLTRFFYTADTGLGLSGLQPKSNFETMVARQADNRLIRPCEAVVGMLTQAQLIPRATPNSDSPDDEDAAALSEILVNLVFENPLNMQEKAEEGLQVSNICGTVCYETEYGETDMPAIVPKYKTERRPNPLYDPEAPEDPRTNPKKVAQQVPDGEETVMRKDFMVRVWTPFHMQPDPAATSPDDMKWICRSNFVDLDWAADQYTGSEEEGYLFEDRDELKDGVSIDSGTKFALYWYAKFQDILETPQSYQQGGGLASQSYLAQGAAGPNQVLLRVVDVKPSKAYPRGRTFITIGGQLVWQGDARSWSEKYPWRWHPYAFHSWFKLPGRFWGVALLSELVPLQKKINAIDALVHANRKYMSIGQWMIPKHSKMREGGPSGLAGENFTFTAVPGMSDPYRVQHTPLPAELLAERADLLQAIEHISATGLVGEQVAKSAARAGSMLNFFRQEKLRSKAPMIQSHERVLEKIGQNILIEADLNLALGDEQLTQRMRAAASEHSNLSIETFSSASLRDHHSIKIDVASQLINTPEAREAKALEFLQALGGSASPIERDAVMRATGMDEFQRGAENSSIERARRMVARVKSGNVEAAFPMQGIDVAAVMAPVFQDELLSDSYHDLEDEQQEALLQLFTIYQQMAAQEAAQQFQMQLQQAQALAAATGGKPPQQPQQGAS